jgi:DNA-binding NtrC family response regulator
VALAREEGLLGLQNLSSLIRDPITAAGNAQRAFVTVANVSSTAGGSVAGARLVGSCGGTTFRENRAAFEARFITDTQERCNSNISDAAKLMGISRVQLQRKIKDYCLR